MIRPLDNQEKLHQGEYINRVNKTDPGHGVAARDFAYAVEEANRENQKRKQHWPGFGEDTYEAMESDEDAVNEEPVPEKKSQDRPSDDRNLDITV